MVHKYAVSKNVRSKCNRKNRRELGLDRIYAGSYCRKYHYYETVTTGGPTLGAAPSCRLETHC